MINDMRSIVAWLFTRNGCILDHKGNKRLHRNVSAKPSDVLRAIQAFREDLVVGAECMFTWYWPADLCQIENSKFILGHARYMKAIHGKRKNDAIPFSDSFPKTGS